MHLQKKIDPIVHRLSAKTIKNNYQGVTFNFRLRFDTGPSEWAKIWRSRSVKPINSGQ